MSITLTPATGGAIPSTPSTQLSPINPTQTAAILRVARIGERFASSSTPFDEPATTLQLRTAHSEELEALQALHLSELSWAGVAKREWEEDGSEDASDVKRVKLEGQDVRPKEEAGDIKPKVEDEAVVLQRQRSLAPTPTPDPPSDQLPAGSAPPVAAIQHLPDSPPAHPPPTLLAANAAVAYSASPSRSSSSAAPARDSRFLKVIDKELASFIRAVQECEVIMHDLASLYISGQGSHDHSRTTSCGYDDSEDLNVVAADAADDMNMFEARMAVFVSRIERAVKEERTPRSPSTAESFVQLASGVVDAETFTTLLKGLQAVEHITTLEDDSITCNIDVLTKAIAEWGHRLPPGDANDINDELSEREPCGEFGIPGFCCHDEVHFRYFPGID